MATLSLSASALSAAAVASFSTRRSPLFASYSGLSSSCKLTANSAKLTCGNFSTSFKRSLSKISAVMTTSATIAVGSPLPDASLSYFDKEGNLQSVSVNELVKGKKVVFFAVPGAFTPTCSQKHLPAFIEKADLLKSKGIDTIACVSVNDPFVMKAWGETVDAGDKVMLLADGSALFTKALGVQLDLTDKGLGIRSRRYALLADDGVVKSLNLEEGGAFTISGPDEILAAL